MSNNAISPGDVELHDAPRNPRPEGLSDILWNQIFQAGDAARTAAVPISPPSPPPRASEPPAHAPASLRLLATTADSIANRDGSAMDPHVQLDELADQHERIAQVIVNRTRALEEGNRRISEEMEAAGREADRIANQAAERQRQQRAAVADQMRRVQEAMRTAELARASMPRRQHVTLEATPNESATEYLRRHQRESTLGYLRNQEEFRERYRRIAELREAASNNGDGDLSSSSSASVLLPLTDSSAESGGIVERSITARRDLERALRDYRLARRALRTQHTNEPSSPGDQNTPSYQGVMAQIAEQQSNNRYRMRARGQSRTNTLDRTDAIVDRIAATAGVGSDAWRSDDDVETVIGPSSTSTSPQSGETGTQTDRALRSTLPVGVSATSEPYLGPTTNARGNGSLSGGMRDFYRRIDERERSAARASLIVSSRMPPPHPNSTARTTVGTSSTVGQPGELNGEQRSQQVIDRFTDTMSQLQTKTGKPSYNACKTRAKKTLKYLSALKQFGNDSDKSRALAKEIGADGLTESLAKHTEVDLPLRMSDLPKPQYSSLLEAGMSWDGTQKGGFTKPDTIFNTLMNGLATGPLFDSGSSIEDRILHLRAWRHRERVRAGRQDRDQTQGGQTPLTSFQEEARGMLRGYAHRTETLADMERHLTDLLEEEDRRTPRGGSDDWRVSGAGVQAGSSSTAAAVEKAGPEDKWPVKITLHEVNWQSMTLSGTMVASQIADSTAPVTTQTNALTITDDYNDKPKTNDADMETFFDGEIIDFSTHELETIADKPGYKIGGAVTDLKYWSRIGPFKEVVEKNIQIATDKKAVETYEKLGITGTVDEQSEEYQRTFKEQQGNAGDLDKDEVGTIVYDTMADCLGSCEWIEKTFGEDGWILMRWKERCFITPSPTQPDTSLSPSTTHGPTASTASGNGNGNEHTRSRTVIHRPSTTPQSYTTSYTDEQHHDRTSLGLTIRGFYYVALHRFSGKVEALYFDSGSQPYQELVCWPVGSVIKPQETGENKGSDDDDETDSGVLDIDVGAIRRDFGVFEFR